MDTTQEKAYKIASTFYLSSDHDGWSGERIRKSILANEDCEDDDALADQQKLEIWEPIERHINSCHPMADPYEELSDLIENLADAFVQFAKDINPSQTK
jgi:hypothetical protein